MKDYTLINLSGTVCSVPERKNSRIYFDATVELEKAAPMKFEVIVMDDPEPIDLNEGDTVSIQNATFWQQDGRLRLAVRCSHGGRALPIRKRCNYGVEEV